MKGSNSPVHPPAGDRPAFRHGPFLRRLAAVVAGMLVMGAACPGQEQEWYKYYDDALQALKSGQCARAIEALRTSIKKKPKPDRRAETQSHFYIKYFPYLMMAKAQALCGQYDRAEEYLRTSESFKEISAKDEEYSTLQELKTSVAKALAEARQPAPSPASSGLAGQLEKGREAYQRGEYEAAQQIFEPLARQTVDEPAAATARQYLADIQAETSALREGERLFNEGRLDEASRQLEKVVGMKRSLAARAQQYISRIEAIRMEASLRHQNLAGLQENIRRHAKAGNFTEAYTLLETISPDDRSKPEIKNLEDETASLVLQEINRRVTADDLDTAGSLCQLLERKRSHDPALPALRQQLNARNKLEEARRLLAAQRWSEARDLLQGLTSQAAVSAEAGRLLTECRRQLDRLAELLPQLDSALQAKNIGLASRLLSELSTNHPFSPALRERRQKLQDLRQAAGQMEIEDHLATALDRIFESGRYQDAITYLSLYLEKKGRRPALARFFRAVAWISLARLEGETNSNQLEQARQDAIALPAGFTPPRRWVSPPVMALIDGWRKNSGHQ